MKKPDILPGKREINYSHGHAHITRNGEPYVSLQLGREGYGLHAEGVHFKLAPDARLIAALPALLQALEEIASPLNKASWERGHARNALTLAGYEF